jgi:hypothetical protein
MIVSILNYVHNKIEMIEFIVRSILFLYLAFEK